MGQKKKSKAKRRTKRSTPILKESQASTSTPLLEQRSTTIAEDASTSTPRLEESITSSPQSDVISESITPSPQSDVISTEASPTTLLLEDRSTTIVKESHASTSTSLGKDAPAFAPRLEESITSSPQSDVISESITYSPQSDVISTEASPTTLLLERRSTTIVKESQASTSTPLGKDAPAFTPRLEESITSTPQSTPQSGVISTKSSTSTPLFDEIITEEAILCSIISSLPTKEAVRTSVLSRRWRHIWTRIHKLYFDASVLDTQSVGLICNGSIGQKDKLELLKGKTNQFIRSVNSVLQHHQGPRVDTFTIHYYLPKIHSHQLDAWVDYAVKLKTKQLVLHLNKPYFREMEIEPYLFPFQLLRPSSSLEELTLSSCSLKPPFTFDGLTNLRKLNLFCVDINEEDIHHLLSNCSTLEHLNISVAPQLMSLTISNVSSQFQYLFIKHCDRLREININAVNLYRLHYWGPVVDFIIRQSPHLRKATILFQTKVIEPDLDFYLNKLLRTMPDLQSLVLHIDGVSKVSDIPKVSHSFMHLTHLDWTWTASIKMSLTCLAILLDFAPILENFKLRCMPHLKERKFFHKKKWDRVIEQPPQDLRNLRRRLPKHPLRHIKTIEIHNFYWDKWQIEIALYLLENASVLESMTLRKGRSSLTEISDKDVQNLSKEFPSNVKLVIL